MRMRPLLAAALLLCLTMPACRDRAADEGRTRANGASRAASARVDPLSRAALPPAAAAALDRANASFRAGQYGAALAGYRDAAARAPAHAAPYYGIYMVARSTNDAALADSAMAAIRARASTASGDSMFAAVHAGATTGALPPGHPAVTPKRPVPWHSPMPPTTTHQ